MEARVEGLIEQLHQITDKSVAVGFGVSGPEQVCPSIADMSRLTTVAQVYKVLSCCIAVEIL